MFPKAQVDALRQFINILKAKPEFLHDPQLDFFRTYLESFGAQIPPKPEESSPKAKAETHPEPQKEVPEEKSAPPPPPSKEEEPVIEEEEKDEPEEDDPDRWEPDADVEPHLPDSSKEVSEGDMDKAMELKAEAVDLQNSGDLEGAINKFTEAIKLNPTAMLFANRANCFMKMKKAKAAIADCTVGIKLNSESAKPYKVRGKAYRHLGDYEKAALDLRKGQQIDYDDDTAVLHKLVEEKAKKTFDHKRRNEIRAREREERERQESLKRRQEELKRRQEELKRQREHEQQEEEEDEERAGAGAFPGGFPGGFPGAAGAGRGRGAGRGAGGKPSPDFMNKMFSDPELMAAMQDPEVQALLPKLMSGDPSVMAQLQSNPKLAKVMAKLGGMFGGGAGRGAGGASSSPPKPPGGQGAGGFPGSHNDVD